MYNTNVWVLPSLLLNCFDDNNSIKRDDRGVSKTFVLSFKFSYTVSKDAFENPKFNHCNEIANALQKLC